MPKAATFFYKEVIYISFNVSATALFQLEHKKNRGPAAFWKICIRVCHIHQSHARILLDFRFSSSHLKKTYSCQQSAAFFNTEMSTD